LDEDDLQFVEAVLEQDRAKDRSAREEEKAALDAYQQASTHLVSKPQILYYPIQCHLNFSEESCPAMRMVAHVSTFSGGNV